MPALQDPRATDCEDFEFCRESVYSRGGISLAIEAEIAQVRVGCVRRLLRKSTGSAALSSSPLMGKPAGTTTGEAPFTSTAKPPARRCRAPLCPLETHELLNALAPLCGAQVRLVSRSAPGKTSRISATRAALSSSAMPGSSGARCVHWASSVDAFSSRNIASRTSSSLLAGSLCGSAQADYSVGGEKWARREWTWQIRLLTSRSARSG